MRYWPSFPTVPGQHRRPPFYKERICSKWRMTVMFASMKRSTQFCMHGSSVLSSLPAVILLVTHLRKQTSVRLWMAVNHVRLRSVCFQSLRSLEVIELVG